MPVDIRRLQEIFGAAVPLAAIDRAALLDRECGDNGDLRRQVENLLRAHDACNGPRTDHAASEATGVYTPINEPAPGTSEFLVAHEPGATIANRYTLVESIGEGGMGEVWVARQSEPIKRRVAVKLIKAGMDSKAVLQRFEAERHALGLMDHPNIAHVFDGGMTDDRRPFFVMELVNGLPISRFCDEAKLSIRERLELFVAVCKAVQHAHQKGIVHRDLKPSNILVTIIDGKPVPKVIDFGVAKAVGGMTEESATQFGAVVGTLEYMAPEQAAYSGADVDTRADIYSLGVILYELLTGLQPIESKRLKQAALTEMIRIIQEDEPSKPSTRLSADKQLPSLALARHTDPKKLMAMLRGELDWVVMKCLEKKRERRYETANGLARDIERYLADEPVEARPPSAAYRLNKFMHRHRAAVIAGLCVAAALVLGIIGTTTGMFWAFLQKSRAESAEQNARISRTAATEQRDLAEERLYESLLREARAIRINRQVGYRADCFDRLRQAAAIATPKRDFAALQAEASRCLGDPVGQTPIAIPGFWAGMPPGERGAACHAIHPAGAFVARGTANGIVEVYDAQTGKQMMSLKGQGEIIDLEFAPTAPCLFGIVAPPEGSPQPAELLEWRRTDGNTWSRYAARPVKGLNHLMLSPGAVIAAVRTSGRDFELMNLETGAKIGAVPAVPLAVSIDWKLVAVVSDDRLTITLRDLTTGEVRGTLSHGMAQIKAAFFNDDASYLACAEHTGIMTFDTRTFERVSTFHGYFQVPSFLDRATLLIPLPQEDAIRLFNVPLNAEVARLSLGSWDVRVASESRTVLAVGKTNHVVRLGGTPERRRFSGHVGGVPAVEFSPDGKQLASIGKDTTIRFWDVATGLQTETWDKLHTPGQVITHSPDGRYVLTSEWDRYQGVIRSRATRQVLLKLWDDESTGGSSYSASFSPNGRYVAMTSRGGLRVWELSPAIGTSEAPLKATPVRTVPGLIWAHQFDVSSQRLCFVSVDPKERGTYVLDLASDKSTPRRVSEWAGTIQSVSLARRDNSFVKSNNATREIEIWKLDSPDDRRTIPTIMSGEARTGNVGNICGSPDGSKLAMVNSTGRGVNILDLATGKRILTLPDELGSVWWLAWSPDSALLAVSRSEGDISVWDLAAAQSAVAEAKLIDPATPDGAEKTKN